ncbi:PilW family protein [Pseudoduganella lutea]|uniref:Prepilin-type N-terminal cleavage/methylation domain-containing protein n=1 Tax=Pseudoduganella lutea TaxID=321985 RepID=A0A4P6L1Z2_9BURK|nr:prepilin-type N-terminal cleavage/methylation domain-containing protein [Pseudoduganella lutea]QBE65459.1 prepilin-type N-terminal cleavage/methylation domain-containing protein [Pseudoduganella lutea]
MSERQAQTGFTLVELLAGLAIAAILVLPLADLLRTGADSARITRAALDLNENARLALGRIARTAADTPEAKAVTDVAPASWLAPVTYTLTGTDLVERKAGISSVIASNVAAFELSAPEVVDGRPLLAIALTLSAEGTTVTRTRTVRVGPRTPDGEQP